MVSVAIDTWAKETAEDLIDTEHAAEAFDVARAPPCDRRCPGSTPRPTIPPVRHESGDRIAVVQVRGRGRRAAGGWPGSAEGPAAPRRRPKGQVEYRRDIRVPWGLAVPIPNRAVGGGVQPLLGQRRGRDTVDLRPLRNTSPGRAQATATHGRGAGGGKGSRQLRARDEAVAIVSTTQ